MNNEMYDQIMKLSDLAFTYSEKSDSATGELKEAYTKTSKELTLMSYKLLSVGSIPEGEFETQATITIQSEGLKLYTKVTVLYEYTNGNALVEDTSGDWYFIPLNHLQKNSERQEL
jgi:hypothetical protein